MYKHLALLWDGWLTTRFKQNTFHVNARRLRWKDRLTHDGDGERAVSLIPWAIGRSVSDAFIPDGEKLRGGINRFHLHRHLMGER